MHEVVGWACWTDFLIKTDFLTKCDLCMLSVNALCGYKLICWFLYINCIHWDVCRCICMVPSMMFTLCVYVYVCMYVCMFSVNVGVCMYVITK